jgi:hypothetical protein
MPPLNSRVWRRYGQLRIYVSADNDPVGWFDPRTGRSHLSRPDRHDEFWAAVRAECQQLLRDGHISESALPPEVSPTAQWEAPAAGSAASPPPSEQHRVVRDPEWDDLARNAPGASASARARALRREHPLLTGAAAMHIKTTGTAVWVGEYGLTIGGKPVDYLRKSRHEATRAGRLLHRATGLEVPVQSAIVFVGARQVTVRRGGPADVAVLPNPRALRRWLCKQPPVLRTDQVEAIYEAARRPASWQSG